MHNSMHNAQCYLVEQPLSLQGFVEQTKEIIIISIFSLSTNLQVTIFQISNISTNAINNQSQYIT